MSTLYEVTTFEFHNDAPSEEQVTACILNAVRQQQYAVDIHWDDYTIELDYHPSRKVFSGRGYFERVHGDFVAKRLNSEIKHGELIL